MKSLLLIGVFLLISGCSVNLIGKKAPPYPEGLETKYGSCVSWALGRDRFCEVSVSDLRRVGENPFAIIVQKEIGRSGNKAIWKITDQTEWPKVHSGEYLSFGVCRLNGAVDHSIIAVVSDNEEQWHVAINWAMRIDLNSGKFIPISPENVLCEDEGWGV